MKKLNQKMQKYIARIDQKIRHAENAFYAKNADLRVHYNMDEIEELSEEEQREEMDWWNYMSWFSEYSADLDVQRFRLDAERAAAMLIGYNIARRGKKLHEKTVMDKTAKLGEDGEFIRWAMSISRFGSCFVTDHPYLHSALAKYGVTLLDANYLDHLQRRLTNMTTQRDNIIKANPDYTPRQLNNRIDKCEKTIKLFHKTLVKQVAIRRAATTNFDMNTPF